MIDWCFIRTISPLGIYTKNVSKFDIPIREQTFVTIARGVWVSKTSSGGSRATGHILNKRGRAQDVENVPDYSNADHK